MQRKAATWIFAISLCAGCATGEPRPMGREGISGDAKVESAAEIAPFLRPGHVVQLSRWADLDGDGDTDAIAVAAPASTSATRTLLILRRRPDGTLERVADNPRAVPSATAGGMFGDPLRDIETHRNGFALHLEGGSRELWSRTYRFGFSDEVRTWLLESVTERVLDRHEGVPSQTQTGTEDFGTVRVDEFDVTEIP